MASEGGGRAAALTGANRAAQWSVHHGLYLTTHYVRLLDRSSDCDKFDENMNNIN